MDNEDKERVNGTIKALIYRVSQKTDDPEWEWTYGDAQWFNARYSGTGERLRSRIQT